MMAVRFGVRQPWLVRSAGLWTRLPALVGTGLVVGAISAMRGREPIEIALAAVFSATLAVLAWTDLERQIVPNRLVYPALALAIVASEAWSDRGLVEALAGGLGALVVTVAIRGLGKGGLGGGDVKMAALAGTVVGYPDVISAALITAVTGGAITLALVVARRVEPAGAVRYGPFIALGVAGVLLH